MAIQFMFRSSSLVHMVLSYLESQMAQNNGPLYPKYTIIID